MALSRSSRARARRLNVLDIVELKRMWWPAGKAGQAMPSRVFNYIVLAVDQGITEGLKSECHYSLCFSVPSKAQNASSGEACSKAVS
jgi:hypothetical protein